MITTSTGAKKLESSDNWREIFPNPGTGTAGAHNATVDAQDRIQAEVAPIINGKRCSLGAASGDYVLLRNSTIAGKTDGAYKATKAIPANTDLDSTYLGSPITGGMVNELNNNLTNKPNFIGGTWTPTTATAITGATGYYAKIGNVCFLIGSFTATNALANGSEIEIGGMPSELAPASAGDINQTIFQAYSVSSGKNMSGRIYGAGLHLYNYTGSEIPASSLYQFNAVFYKA